MIGSYVIVRLNVHRGQTRRKQSHSRLVPGSPQDNRKLCFATSVGHSLLLLPSIDFRGARSRGPIHDTAAREFEEVPNLGSCALSLLRENPYQHRPLTEIKYIDQRALAMPCLVPRYRLCTASASNGTHIMTSSAPPSVMLCIRIAGGGSDRRGEGRLFLVARLRCAPDGRAPRGVRVVAGFGFRCSCPAPGAGRGALACS